MVCVEVKKYTEKGNPSFARSVVERGTREAEGLLLTAEEKGIVL
jgi:hypothetical protein